MVLFPDFYILIILDAYWNEYNDAIEDIQATEIMYDGSFESYYNSTDHSFGVVKQII